MRSPASFISAKIALGIVLLAAAAGCGADTSTGVAIPECAFFGCGGTFSPPPAQPCVEARQAITPGNKNILVGGLLVFGTTGRCLLPTWRTDADVIDVLDPKGQAVSDTFRIGTVTVRGRRAGMATLTAEWASGPSPALATILVADSSAIAHVRLDVLSGSHTTATIKVGEWRALSLALVDRNGQVYYGAPTAIWSTDTNVVRLSGIRDEVFSWGTEYRATVDTRTTGTARIVAAFLNVRDTMTVQVVP